MRLGVDVDGVVLDSGTLYNTAFEKRGYILNSRKKNEWDFKEAYGISPEKVNEVLREVEQITDVPLIPGAQILNKIVNLPHIESPIHFVSSRHISSFYTTVEALQQYFSFPIYLRCSTDKGQYCNDYDLDFFVEDGPPHIRDIYWNSKTFIYILDKPYNREIDLPDCMNTWRVKNWSEIMLALQREGYREAVCVSESSHNL